MSSQATPSPLRAGSVATLVAIVALALTGWLTLVPRAIAAPVDPYAFAETVDREAIAEHLQQFQQIADDNDGNRADGTPGGIASSDYIIDTLTEAGYEPELQTFTTNAGTESVNIIASTPTGRTDNVSILGAHYDGVPEGAGMNDNASGTSALLQVAVELIAEDPLTNQVRFAFWGAEETGLEGSYAYVDDLDPAELDAVAVYLNYDMIGSPNYLIGVEDGKAGTYNDRPLADGSAQAMDLQTDYFDAIDQPWQPSEMCCTDYDSFHEAGVPVGGLYTGGEALKTQEEVDRFGGQLGEYPDANYHTADDDLDNVSAEAVSINTGVIAFSAASLGLSTEAINGVAAPTPTPTPSVTATAGESPSATPTPTPSTSPTPSPSAPTSSTPGPTGSVSDSPEPTTEPTESAHPSPASSDTPSSSPDPVTDPNTEPRWPLPTGSMAETGAPALGVVAAGALAALAASAVMLRRRR